ncbi:M23 family metallopeptidase [Coralloluteibacterium stylophorae]|uniref:Peptidoglycan DD-metalloendopeptidase family protein n=1 Tax=Coralloluteibacterium stylophorae TaxID=1776034 RepID=A0AAP2CCI3_9GAMM|nr:M23 family metallopeptidase [Coralloluteibacterium stylophorae]MBS7457734.1 peptidoglycan DD-metalloendopeptidase family protein [Coralloluteibacterium stylophorae]
MNFIIVSKRFRTPKKFSLGERRVQIAAGGALALLLGLGVGLGMLVQGGAQARRVAEMQARIDAQQAELADAQNAAQREVNALAARVGELQAQANRLNALGERLTRIGKIDDGEFDFTEPSGQGGAEAPQRAIARDELLGQLDALSGELSASGSQLDLLETLLVDRDLAQNQMPSRWPVARGYISSGFGGRADPFGGGLSRHMGVDFASPYNSDVLAVAEGVVSFVGRRSGYGNVVEVDHGNGYTTLYGHNSRNLVKVGDLVRAGDVLAKVGSTGRSTGNHVHLEVHANGRPVDPLKYLQGKVGRRSSRG